jgi:hypothetical protein
MRMAMPMVMPVVMPVVMRMILFTALFLAVPVFMSAVILPFHASHLTSVAGPPAETGVPSTRAYAAPPADGNPS